MEDLKEKYIDLLLLRCVNFNNSKSLFINYDKGNRDFINSLVQRARSLGIEDIYLDEEDEFKKHDVLKSISLEEIDSHPMFNKSKWDEYALKNASFIILKTEYPGLMDDVEPEKLARCEYAELASKQIYRKLQLSFKIPWTIAALPSVMWAKSLFSDLSEWEAYNKLFSLICKMCMVDTQDPIKSWDNYLRSHLDYERKLNELYISSMHYKNSLGTDLYVELTPNTFWSSAASLGENMFVNMPSYEIFTNPNFRKTEGIVYGSMPLFYNGSVIDDFFLEFEKGKVVNFDAKKGIALLKSILESDEHSSYLGEAALVDISCPISQTGYVYGNTLFDENASCHLALGNGTADCVVNGDTMSSEELLKLGVNPSKNHVDFMIGTPDLNVYAKTCEGNRLILKNGRYNI